MEHNTHNKKIGIKPIKSLLSCVEGLTQELLYSEVNKDMSNSKFKLNSDIKLLDFYKSKNSKYTYYLLLKFNFTDDNLLNYNGLHVYKFYLKSKKITFLGNNEKNHNECYWDLKIENSRNYYNSIWSLRFKLFDFNKQIEKESKTLML